MSDLQPRQTEIVDRVAEAIHRATMQRHGGAVIPWPKLDREVRDEYRADATAAIEAMERERA